MTWRWINDLLVRWHGSELAESLHAAVGQKKRRNPLCVLALGRMAWGHASTPPVMRDFGHSAPGRAQETKYCTSVITVFHSMLSKSFGLVLREQQQSIVIAGTRGERLRI